MIGVDNLDRYILLIVRQKGLKLFKSSLMLLKQGRFNKISWLSSMREDYSI